MCGIVGYIGQPTAQDVLLDGLEKLEYRGYDSAGIYVNDASGNGKLFKATGQISALKAKVDFAFPGTRGIGHTRWATHGVPSSENAHPHVSASGRFYLVHNGVIENYLALKEDKLADVDFYGETDTEVVVNLIDYYAQNGAVNGKEAFRRALADVEGSYAFVLADTENPDVLYAAKNKSPMLIGIGDGFNALGSDAMALIAWTKRFIEIKDQELVTLSRQTVNIEKIADGEVVKRAAYTASLDPQALDKGTYPYYMMKEIAEQPAVIRKIIQHYQNGAGKLTIDADIIASILEASDIYLIGSGTSYHAGLLGKQFFEKWAKIPTQVYLASEFAYNPPMLGKKPFFIYLTQSGETADSRQVLVQTNAAGYPALTITNVAGSTLSREADFTLLLEAGPEIAVASTKAYTAQIALQAIVANAVTEAKFGESALNLVHELGLVATAMVTVLDEKDRYTALAKNYLSGRHNAFYIGRGIDYAVAREAALKLKEISYIHTEGFAAGELKHGTIALIEEGTPVIGFITQEGTAAHTRGNLAEVQARGASTLVMAMEGLAKDGDEIVLPAVHPDLAALLAIVPAQLLAYEETLARGYDVDKPRNLAKSVTVE